VALARTTLTSGTSAADAATYDTASVTLTSGRLYILAVISLDAGAPEQDPTGIATVGGAITFTKNANGQVFPTFARTVSTWRVIAGSTVTDAIRITLNDAGTGCSWWVHEYTGHDATTPVVQSVGANASDTTVSATLAALANSNSHQLAFGAVEGTTTNQTVSGTDWAEVGADITGSTPNHLFACAENTAGTATQVTFTGHSQERAVVVVEIKASPTGGSDPAHLMSSPLFNSRLLTSPLFGH
jgi:hypothetical protein